MKTLKWILPLLFLGATAFGQGLADIYKGGVVNLHSSSDFGTGTTWESVFSGGVDKGKTRSSACSDLAMADDGAMFVVDGQDRIVKLDAHGHIVKTFGGRGSDDGQFSERPRVEGVLDNRYVVVSEQNGRISLFDLDGRFQQDVTIDYMPLACVPLKDGKIAISGHVPYNEKVRLVVAIKDINTDDETIVDSRFTTVEGRAVKTGDEDHTVWIARSYEQLQACIAQTSDGNLAVGWNDQPEVNVYAHDGALVSSVHLQTKTVAVTEADREELRNQIKVIIDSTTKAGHINIKLDSAMEASSLPDHLPYFHKLMVDPDGNLLVFIYSKRGEAAVQVEAYRLSGAGQYLATARMESADYDIGVCLGRQSLAFRGGKLYGIAAPRSAGDSVPRVVEFTLTK